MMIHENKKQLDSHVTILNMVKFAYVSFNW